MEASLGFESVQFYCEVTGNLGEGIKVEKVEVVLARWNDFTTDGVVEFNYIFLRICWSTDVRLFNVTIKCLCF